MKARFPLLLCGAAALLAGAVLLALLASDVLAWQQRFRIQDISYANGDPGASWRISASFPFADPARRLLGVGDDLAYRRALLVYRGLATGPSFDNGATQREAQSAAQVALARIEQADADGARASRAANLLGILALAGPVAIAPGQPDPVDRALAEFGNAVRLDPGNGDAKLNLELLLRQLQAHGQRSGNNGGQSGRSSGRHGAGLSLPGQGY